MEYRNWQRDKLEKILINVNNKNTAVWCSPISNKPLLLMIHGIGSDRHDLAGLAYELSVCYRVAIIELPGHGDSDQVQLPDTISLQIWFKDNLQSITKTIGEPYIICPHSFGCSAVLSKEIIDKYKIVLIGPVSQPSSLYSSYATIIMKSAVFWSYIYSWKPFIYIRARSLVHTPGKEARDRVLWAYYNSRSDYSTTKYQAGLIKILLDHTAYKHASSGKVSLVICGKKDYLVRERDHSSLSKIFGSTKIVFVDGGHLFPIEAPKSVAKIINLLAN